MKNKKGFTLVELVTVLAVIAVLFGLSVPFVSQYITTSRMIKYNDHAKTIFLSAQSYLTNLKSSGQLEEFSGLAQSDTKKVPKDIVVPEYYAEGTSFLKLSKNGSNDDLLRDLLGDYILDPFILNQSICLEYNAFTGMVHSVAYSEVADSLEYGVVTGKQADIHDRSDASRQTNRFGYYQASLLSPPSRAQKLDDSNVRLVNDEQLYMQWSDAEPDGSTGNGDIIYNVKIFEVGGSGGDTLLQSITIPAGTVPVQGSGITTLSHYLREYESVYYNPTSNVSHTNKYWVYRKKSTTNPTRNDFVLVLDSVDTSLNSGGEPLRSITSASYNSIGSRNLRVSISATGPYYAPNNEILSNAEHSLLGGNEHGLVVDGKANIKFMRHLFNLRYAENGLNLTQTASISWQELLESGRLINGEELVKKENVLKSDGAVKNDSSPLSAYAFTTIKYFDSNNVTIEQPFSGSYDGGDKEINDLYITPGYKTGTSGVRELSGSAGLFSQNNGEIKSMKLLGLTLEGEKAKLGSVAAENLLSAKILNSEISIKGLKNGPDANDNVGGVTGVNEGVIKDVTLNAANVNISSTANIGGITGQSSNTVENVVLNSGSMKLSGTNNIGGIVGQNSGHIIGATLDAVKMELAGSNANNIGGIAGQSSGYITNAAITAKDMKLGGGGNVGGIAGINTAYITTAVLTANGIEISGTTNVGGIAGQNTAFITSSTLKALGTGGVKISGTANTGGTGGIVGQNSGKIDGSEVEGFVISGLKNVGGIVGLNNSGGSLVGGINVKGGSITGREGSGTEDGFFVGGIIGMNNSAEKLTGIDNSSVVRGISEVGGIVGRNNGAVISDCENKGTVTGANDGTDIGGVIGKNADSNGKTFTGLKNSGDVEGGSYVGGIVGTNLDATLRECENKGVVLARKEYAGGITGANGQSSDTAIAAQIIKCTTVMEGVSVDDVPSKLNGQLADYVGGIAGYNNGRITGDGVTMKISGAVFGGSYVGGVAGHNDSLGTVRFYEVIDGIVAGKGNFVGGYFGLNTSRQSATDGANTMDLKAAPKLVRGESYVGGVIGANLVALSSGGSGTALILTITAGKASGGGQSQSGSVEATEIAGGIIGYNGVITGSGGENELRQTLNELQNRDKFAELPGDNSSTASPATRLLGCKSYLSVTAGRYVGGMLGYNNQSSKLLVENCGNYGDLKVENKGFTGDYYYIGGITGRNSESGVISGSSNNGNITSLSKYTGGIVEVNNGKIIKCENTRNISSEKGWVGGIVGLNGETQENAEVTDCTASGTVTGKGDCVGGIAGENKAAIKDCKGVKVLVKGYKSYVGGIVGRNSDNAEMSGGTVDSASTVIGLEYVGGIVGKNEADVTMENIINSATVTGANFVGGIAGSKTNVGDNTSSRNVDFKGCENKGKVTATKKPADIGELNMPGDKRIEVGGIVGLNNSSGVIENCTNNGEVSGWGSYTGGIVSYNDGMLRGCVAGEYGKVVGSYSAGGVVGLNNGNIHRTDDSKTLASSVSSSFDYDKETGAAVYIGGLMAENSKSTLYNSVREYSFTGELSYTKPSSAIPKDIETGQFAGGIVGKLAKTGKDGNEIVVESCEYLGEIQGGNAGSGGIVGISYGAVSYIEAIGKDTGKLAVSSTGVSGGAIGLCMPDSTVDFLTVTNSDSLTVTGGRGVGGLIGKYNTTGKQITFSDIYNHATVRGYAAVGGIIGEVTSTTATDGGSVKFTSCINLGEIYGSVLPDNIKSDDLNRVRDDATNTGGVGGIVGLAAQRQVSFEKCINGKDEANGGGAVVAFDGKSGVYSSGAGGILGRAKAAEPYSQGVVWAELTDCKNYGSISGNGTGAGGIIGYTDTETLAESCVNYAAVSGSADASSQSIGGILGHKVTKARASAGLKLINCISGNIITGRQGVGGIAGWVDGRGSGANNPSQIEQCQNLGGVTSVGGVSGSYLGGIVGYAIAGENGKIVISECVNGLTNSDGSAFPTQPSVTAGQKGASRMGGIVGGSGRETDVAKGEKVLTVKSSKNYMPITNTTGGQYIGGIFGFTEGNGVYINDCQNLETGIVTANGNAEARSGGIVGALKSSEGTSTGKNIVENCQNSANVIGKSELGGIVGHCIGLEISITDSTNLGSVSSGGDMTGGIAGHVEWGSTMIDNCTNGAPGGGGTVNSRSKQTGGIVGKFRVRYDSSVVKNSKNYMPIVTTRAGNSANVGGIVGELENGSVLGCENFGAIEPTQKISNIGGIVGASHNGIITGNKNRGAITVAVAGGDTNEGIGGILGAAKGGNKLKVTDSVNYAEINIKSGSANIGGNIGAVSIGINTDIRSLVNLGDITVDTINGSCVGGVVGWFRKFSGERLMLTESANFGKIAVKSITGNMNHIGGVGGKLEFCNISYTMNFGDISVEAENGINYVGGLAGHMFKTTSTLRRSLNAGNIENKNVLEVGGVVGHNEGVIASCRNTQLDPNADNSALLPPKLTDLLEFAEQANGAALPFARNPKIQGGKYIGGIVGGTKATDATESGIIYSEKSGDEAEKRFDAVSNSMPVTAEADYAGGIVGTAEGGSIVGAYNTGEVHSGTDTTSAGGAVGYARSLVTSAGGSFAAFNLGALTGGDNSGIKKSSGFRGGAVGKRATEKITIGDSSVASTDLFSVKQNYSIEKSIPVTTVESATLGTSTGRWRVGNEPESSGGKRDDPKADGGKDILYLLDSESFNSEYKERTGKDLPLDFDSLSASEKIEIIEEYLRAYVVPLDPPEITSVKVNPEVSGGYTVEWTAPGGVVGGYEIEYEILDGDHNPTGIKKTVTVDKDTYRTNGYDFESEYIGKFFRVHVKALGDYGEDGIKGTEDDISGDSGWSEYKSPYLILAPMLAPKVSFQPLGDTTYRITIGASSNLADYRKPQKPYEDYPNLENIKGETDEETEWYKTAYEKYENGLGSIIMVDPTNKDRLLTFAKNEKGEYYLDYTFNLGNDVEKEFTLNFYALPKLTPDDIYKVVAYYRSNTTTEKITIVVAKKLVVSNPKTEFRNTATVDNPAYDFYFDGDKNASKYEIYVTDESGNRVYSGELPGGGSAGMKVAIMPELLKVEDYYGKKLTVHVKAIGDNRKWLDSDEISAELNVLRKLEPPKVEIKKIPGTDKYECSWNGDPDGGNYVVTIIQKNTKTNEEKKLTSFTNDTTDQKSFTVDYTYKNTEKDTEIEDGFILTATVEQLGKHGETVTSEKATATGEVKARLPINNEKAVSMTPVGDLTYTIGFSSVIPSGFPYGDCAGFEVFYSYNNEVKQIGGRVPANENSLEHTFPEELIGKSISVFIKAVGIDGKSSDSLENQYFQWTFPMRVLPPTDVKVTPSPAAGSVENSAYFNTTEYKVTWKPPQNTAYTGFKVRLLDENDVTIAEQTVGGNEWNLGKISADYAGKTLKVEVCTHAENSINSEWVPVSLNIPKLQLDPPTGITVGASGVDGVTIGWSSVTYATGYELTFDDGTTEVVPGPQNSYTVQDGRTAETLTAIGDGTHYVTSAPAAIPTTRDLEPPPMRSNGGGISSIIPGIVPGSSGISPPPPSKWEDGEPPDIVDPSGEPPPDTPPDEADDMPEPLGNGWWDSAILFLPTAAYELKGVK